MEQKGIRLRYRSFPLYLLSVDRRGPGIVSHDSRLSVVNVEVHGRTQGQGGVKEVEEDEIMLT